MVGIARKTPGLGQMKYNILAELILCVTIKSLVWMAR